MDGTVISDTLTVTGAAALVATFVEYTKILIDLVVKDQVTNIRLTRLYVFLVSIALVSLPPLQHQGLHMQGDLLSLLTLASVIASGALGGWHLFTKTPIQTPTEPAPAVVIEPPVA